MRTNIGLETDPYAGARAAYFALLPQENDASWETWIEKGTKGSNDPFDNFTAFGNICVDALAVCADELTVPQVRQIAFAAGFFRAVDSLVKGVIDILPTSPHVPHHFLRYRSNLKRFPERYVDIESDLPF